VFVSETVTSANRYCDQNHFVMHYQNQSEKKIQVFAFTICEKIADRENFSIILKFFPFLVGIFKDDKTCYTKGNHNCQGFA